MLSGRTNLERAVSPNVRPAIGDHDRQRGDGHAHVNRLFDPAGQDKSVEPDGLIRGAVIVNHVDVIGSGRHRYVITRAARCDHVSVVMAGRTHLDLDVARRVIAVRHGDFQVSVCGGHRPCGKPA